MAKPDPRVKYLLSLYQSAVRKDKEQKRNENNKTIKINEK
jgi:hypothetical protein